MVKIIVYVLCSAIIIGETGALIFGHMRPFLIFQAIFNIFWSAGLIYWNFNFYRHGAYFITRKGPGFRKRTSK